MFFVVSVLALFSLASATQCPPPGSVRYMVPHETDCSKFYICAHGVPLLQSCPDGTHFNSLFMVCQNPVFAGCSDELPESELECSWPDAVLFRPHPGSCNKYYVCEHGSPLVFDCPDGTEFNAELKECVWPHQSDCNNYGSDGSPTDAPETGSQDGGPQESGPEDGGPQESGPEDGGPQESGPEDGGPQESGPEDGGPQNGGCTEGALSAHSDCSKYSICNHGAQVAMDCPPGLQWSSELEQCVWPHQSDCNNYGSDGSPTDAPESGPQESGPEDGGPQNGGCTEGALSAHSDCSKYSICNHGAQVAMDCSPGLQWSSELEQCVWPHQSDCNNYGSDGSPTDAPETGSQDAGPQEPGPEDAGPQDGGCTEGALSAHSDCSKYNICNHGAQVAMDCSPGLQWSSELEQCVWPHQSDCNNYGSDGSPTDAPETGSQDAGPQEPGPEDAGPQDGGCTEGALSAHSDCSKYNICNHGAQVAMDCSPGLQWSSELEQCVWPHQSDCNNYGSDGSPTDAPESGPQESGPEDGGPQESGPEYGGPQESGPEDGGSQDGGWGCEEGALSAHDDCNKYNKCNHGVAVAMDCPPGLHWNSILQHCDWPLTAGCA